LDLKKARTVFMGTPEYSIPVFDMLIGTGYNIVCAVTQTDKERGRGKKLVPPPVKEAALKQKIPVLQPQTLKTQAFEQELSRFSPQLYITIAYGKIIPGNILGIPEYGCINVHASLLPKYRGPAPLRWVLINGEKETGVTTMYSDAGIDTGKMLLQRKINIDDNMTYGALHDRSAVLSAETLFETLTMLRDGTISPADQNDSEASYAPMITKETGHIDWNKSAKAVRDLTRGLDPYPCAYSFCEGERMKIIEAKINGGIINGAPGMVVKVEKNSFTVRCADTGLDIIRIQMPGRNVMRVSEYLNGNTIKEGTILG
jgi:methionyl-tRNA formyltransferase